MKNNELGSRYEQSAAVYLENKGFKILETNFRCRGGEIDIVARDGNTLVFVEVKYRSGTGRGDASEAVTPVKQLRLRRAAGFYMMKNRLGTDADCRFDVIAINGFRLDHYKNAF